MRPLSRIEGGGPSVWGEGAALTWWDRRGGPQVLLDRLSEGRERSSLVVVVESGEVELTMRTSFKDEQRPPLVPLIQLRTMPPHR
jgi:hypothetical protein